MKLCVRRKRRKYLKQSHYHFGWKYTFAETIEKSVRESFITSVKKGVSFFIERLLASNLVKGAFKKYVRPEGGGGGGWTKSEQKRTGGGGGGGGGAFTICVRSLFKKLYGQFCSRWL